MMSIEFGVNIDLCCWKGTLLISNSAKIARIFYFY